MHTNPSKIFGFPQIAIAKGNKAKYSLYFNPALNLNSCRDHIKSKSKNSPFIDKDLSGKVAGIINDKSIYAPQAELCLAGNYARYFQIQNRLDLRDHWSADLHRACYFFVTPALLPSPVSFGWLCFHIIYRCTYFLFYRSKGKKNPIMAALLPSRKYFKASCSLY